MSDLMIEFRDVTKRFGQLVANDRLNLHVQRGELMTLLGPSGCGKTTALRCLTGFLRPDDGQIFIDGKDVTLLPPYQRQLGMVFQNFALFPHMTVWENVRFPLMIRGISKDSSQERVRDALTQVHLGGYGDHFPRQLSGGQQQRVGLARALVYRPMVLLLDEPLSNLDAKLREEMRFEIRDLQRRLGITAIYVTHDQEEALALSDRVAIMNKGKLEQLGTPEEIYKQPKSRFVADFIGLSNFIPAQYEGVDGESAVVSVGTARLKVPACVGLVPGKPVLLFIRPNDVDLSCDQHQDNTLNGVVTKITYLGDRMDYRIRVGEQELRIQTGDMDRREPGENVCLRFPSDRCRLIAEE